jgi:hypothetical protein
LLVDFGVLVPKDPRILTDEFDPSSEVIIEWRALTVALLDKLHEIILQRLNFTAEAFPLVKVRIVRLPRYATYKQLTKRVVDAQMLEGGSWKAGRVIAKDKRAGGGPPITIKSDGTVF